MPSKVKILPSKSQAHFVEESQDKKIFMCYATKLEKNVFQKLHHMAICRDYFGDAIYSEQSGREISIFGFHWGPKYPDLKLDRDKTRFCFKGSDEDDLGNLEKNLSILNKIEKKNGLVPTTFLEGEKEKGWEIIIEGDSKWMSSIFLISLYTYLLKCMCYEIKDKGKWVDCIIAHKTKESNYVSPYQDIFVKVLDNLERFGYDKASKDVKVHGQETDQLYAGTVHSSSGWVTVISCPSPKNFYCGVVQELRKEAA